jgi:biotin carboxyl carrier protein
MPEPSSHADRTPAQREADHAALARLSETLVPALVQKLNASGLGELEIREGGWRVRLRRPAGAAAAGPAPRRSDRLRPAGHGPEREARAHDAGRDAPAVGSAAADEARRAVATSPAVGIFRPTASLGTRLEAGDRLGTVDLLGIAQDVVAPVDGTLAEIMVAAGDAVEYGEPVAAVDADPPGPAAADPDGEG